MTCYEIARKIMDRIRRTAPDYASKTHMEFRGVQYYDSSHDHEYFCFKDKSVEIQVTYGEISYVQINNPRGVVYLDFRLWLMQIDKMTAKDVLQTHNNVR